jgi:prevent-host-death family protein
MVVFVYYVHNLCADEVFMSISIAQSRQQLSSLIALAQQQPQVITNRNKPVAVLVSADYFAGHQAVAQTEAQSFFNRVQGLREKFAPQDDTGLDAAASTARQTAWQRGNAFSDTV